MNFSRSWEVVGPGASVAREEQECGTCVTSTARSPLAAESSPLDLEFSSYAMIVHVTVHVCSQQNLLAHVYHPYIHSPLQLTLIIIITIRRHVQLNKECFVFVDWHSKIFQLQLQN